MKIPKQDYNLFRNFLENACGIVLGDNKGYLVSSRLGSLIEDYQFSNIKELIVKLQDNTQLQLREEVIDAMTTNETNWFRDDHPYQILVKKVFPQFKKKSTIKIWSAACSSGQEPFTVSMCVSEYKRHNPGIFPQEVEIVGTDISQTMLNKAKNGIYEKLEMDRGISEERYHYFFDNIDNGKMQLKEKELKRVNYRLLNLLNDFSHLGQFEVIFCRNVLIYFAPKMKVDILTRLADNLVPGGYLFLGASEPVPEDCKKYQMINCNPGIVYQKV